MTIYDTICNLEKLNILLLILAVNDYHCVISFFLAQTYKLYKMTVIINSCFFFYISIIYISRIPKIPKN